MDIVGLIVIAVFIMLPLLVELKKQKTQAMPKPPEMKMQEQEDLVDFPEEQMAFEMESEDGPFLHETPGKIPKQPHIDNQSPNGRKKSRKSDVESDRVGCALQDSVNEGDSSGLSFNEEEIYKGFIYSEIFKKRYN